MIKVCFPALLLVAVLCLGAVPSRANQDRTEGPEFTEPTTGMEFIRVEGGCFGMGSDPGEPGRYDDEGPQREVCVDTFMLSRYEVTNAQYRLLRPEHDSRSHEGESLNGEHQPVVFVSWNEAKNYARWLSGKTGRQFRLPNEAEWEYAARAGNQAAHFWGEDQSRTCRYANVGDRTAGNNWQNWANWPIFGCDDGYTVSAPVGSFAANPLGLYDMLGNVWEWTSDGYTDTYTPGSRPLSGTGRSLSRSLRGGSWYSGPRNTRTARRSWSRPDSRCNSLGFRLVLALE